MGASVIAAACARPKADLQSKAMTVFVLMGVSGAGKSTIGRQAADALGVPFLEGDDFHPAASVAKMSAGVPLTDADRMPWIDAIVAHLNARPERDVILACSALSTAVRDRLRTGLDSPVQFLLLSAPPDVIGRRLQQRPGHYMKAGMLGSQFAALQTPADAIAIDVTPPQEVVTREVVRHIQPMLAD